MQGFSTFVSIGGTAIVLLTFFIFFAVSIVQTFLAHGPTINDVTEGSIDDEYTLPDVALTISAEMSEASILRYLTPEFSWVSISDGMKNRGNSVRSLAGDVQTGAGCNLQAGYRRSQGGDTGSFVWPVFCLLSSKEKLRGRYVVVRPPGISQF